MMTYSVPYPEESPVREVLSEVFTLGKFSALLLVASLAGMAYIGWHSVSDERNALAFDQCIQTAMTASPWLREHEIAQCQFLYHTPEIGLYDSTSHMTISLAMIRRPNFD